MIAIMLFMAIVSTGSAESIAVSSIVAYDIYGTYGNKSPTSDDILKISRITVIVFGLIMGVLSIILFEMGIGLGWVYLFMGIMIGSAVSLLALMMTWDKLRARSRRSRRGPARSSPSSRGSSRARRWA